MHLRAMAEGKFPLGVIASLFRQQIGPLRTMCFLDNEYGDQQDTGSRVAALARNAMYRMNQDLTRGAKPLRVIALQPSAKLQHHVEISIRQRHGSVSRVHTYKVNLYIPNPSAPKSEEEQEEGVTAAGPRFSMTRLKGVAKPRRGGDRERRRARARRKAIRVLTALQAQPAGCPVESALEPKEKPAAGLTKPRAAKSR